MLICHRLCIMHYAIHKSIKKTGYCGRPLLLSAARYCSLAWVSPLDRSNSAIASSDETPNLTNISWNSNRDTQFFTLTNMDSLMSIFLWKPTCPLGSSRSGSQSWLFHCMFVFLVAFLHPSDKRQIVDNQTCWDHVCSGCPKSDQPPSFGGTRQLWRKIRQQHSRLATGRRDIRLHSWNFLAIVNVPALLHRLSASCDQFLFLPTLLASSTW